VTVVILQLISLVTFTNWSKPFTGTPICNFFQFVGISQPLGVEVKSPAHIAGARLDLEVEYVLVVFVVELRVYVIPFLGVQNPTLLASFSFILTIWKANDCSCPLMNRKSPVRPIKLVFENARTRFGPFWETRRFSRSVAEVLETFAIWKPKFAVLVFSIAMANAIVAS